MYSYQCIYIIKSKVDENLKVYIGSTNKFNQRKNTHKYYCENKKDKSPYNYINENGSWENWEMTILEKTSFLENKDLRRREADYIEKFKKENCLNINKPIMSKIQEEKIKKKNLIKSLRN